MSLPNNNSLPYLSRAEDKDKDTPYVYLDPQEPSELPPGTVGVEILKWSKEGELLANKLPESYREENLKTKRATTTILIGTSNNRWGQLGQLGKSLKNGPYHMDGRDGQLTIHNKKKNAPIFATYTFAGGNGELLEFNVQSSYVKSAVEVSRNTEIDGDTKTMTTTVVQGMVDPNQGNPDAYYDWGITPMYNSRGYKNLPGPYSDLHLETKSTGTILPQETLKSIKPSFGDYPNVFNSKDEATAYIKSNPRLTKEEREAWLNGMAQKHKAYTGQTYTVGNVESTLKEGFNWEPCVIKRKVTVRHRVHPSNYASYEANVKPVAGKHSNVPYEHRRWKQGYQYLKEAPNITIIPRDKGYSSGDLVEIVESLELEVPLEGVRVLADTPNFDTPEFFSNNIQNTLTNQVKANARVLGRPGLESSMNIEINNVSSKYSGIWYTKKVIHRINIGTGYTVDLEFTQRDNPISTITITKETSLQKTTIDLNKKAKEALKTGSYNKSSKFNSYIKDWVQSKYPDKSHLIVMDPDDPSRYSVYVANKDFATEYQEGKTLDTNVLKAVQDGKIVKVGTFRIKP